MPVNRPNLDHSPNSLVANAGWTIYAPLEVGVPRAKSPWPQLATRARSGVFAGASTCASPRSSGCAVSSDLNSMSAHLRLGTRRPRLATRRSGSCSMPSRRPIEPRARLLSARSCSLRSMACTAPLTTGLPGERRRSKSPTRCRVRRLTCRSRPCGRRRTSGGRGPGRWPVAVGLAPCGVAATITGHARSTIAGARCAALPCGSLDAVNGWAKRGRSGLERSVPIRSEDLSAGRGAAPEWLFCPSGQNWC